MGGSVDVLELLLDVDSDEEGVESELDEDSEAEEEEDSVEEEELSWEEEAGGCVGTGVGA